MSFLLLKNKIQLFLHPQDSCQSLSLVRLSGIELFRGQLFVFPMFIFGASALFLGALFTGCSNDNNGCQITSDDFAGGAITYDCQGGSTCTAFTNSMLTDAGLLNYCSGSTHYYQRTCYPCISGFQAFGKQLQF